MEKLIMSFAEFVNEMSEREVEGLCAAKLGINWDGKSFFVVENGSSSGVSVYNSDGAADVPISTSNMRKFLISDSENLLQGVFYG